MGKPILDNTQMQWLYALAMILKTGTLPNTKGTLFTCELAGGLKLDSIHVVNNYPAQVGVNLYTNIGGTVNRIIAKDLQFAEGAHGFIERPIYLNLNDSIEGEVDTGSLTIYQIMAIEARAGV